VKGAGHNHGVDWWSLVRKKLDFYFYIGSHDIRNAQRNQSFQDKKQKQIRKTSNDHGLGYLNASYVF
jgi:hypothetical protein